MISRGNVNPDIHYTFEVKVEQHVTFSSVTVMVIGNSLQYVT